MCLTHLTNATGPQHDHCHTVSSKEHNQSVQISSTRHKNSRGFSFQIAKGTILPLRPGHTAHGSPCKEDPRLPAQIRDISIPWPNMAYSEQVPCMSNRVRPGVRNISASVVRTTNRLLRRLAMDEARLGLLDGQMTWTLSKSTPLPPLSFFFFFFLLLLS